MMPRSRRTIRHIKAALLTAGAITILASAVVYPPLAVAAFMAMLVVMLYNIIFETVS